MQPGWNMLRFVALLEGRKMVEEFDLQRLMFEIDLYGHYS